jgi:hypothetical protein
MFRDLVEKLRVRLFAVVGSRYVQLFVAGFIAALLMVNCLGCGARPRIVSETFPAPAVAKLNIDWLDDGGRAHGATCTTWKIGINELATAGHCCAISDAAIYTINKEPVTVAYEDAVRDICILKGTIPGPILHLAQKDPELGERVWTWGYPLGTLLISDGFWSGRDTLDDLPYGVCSVSVAGGASGSPVLNSNNQVIGLLVAGSTRLQTMTFVVPVEYLTEALKKLHKA